MNLDLKNKTALVCGASQGLGFASATELALMSANIIAVSRNKNKLQSAIKNLDTSKGQTHNFLVIDLSNPGEVKQTVNSFLAKDNVIHILINNAGGPPSGRTVFPCAAVIGLRKSDMGTAVSARKRFYKLFNINGLWRNPQAWN